MIKLTADEMMMAKQIVNSIIKDGMSRHFIGGTDQFKKEVMFAYLDGEIKKFEKFQTKMITDQEARKTFTEFILLLV